MDRYVCIICGYVYDPAVGDPESGIAPGTAFEDIPDDWVCPLCGVGKEHFEKTSYGIEEYPARATKVKSLGNDKYGYASSGLNDEPNERGIFNYKVSGTPADTLGYFKTWRQWKKPARGDATTTP